MSSLASAQSAQRDLERQIERQIRIIREKNEEIEALRARIRGLEELKGHSIVSGEWRWENYQLLWRGTPIRLSPMESEIVSLLIRRAGRLVRYENIIEMIYPNIDDAPTRVKSVIWVLTSKIRAKSERRIPIRTVWGRGLVWEQSNE